MCQAVCGKRGDREREREIEREREKDGGREGGRECNIWRAPIVGGCIVMLPDYPLHLAKQACRIPSGSCLWLALHQSVQWVESRTRT